MLKKVRPDEWVFLFFVAYCDLWLLFGHPSGFDNNWASFPRAEILILVGFAILTKNLRISGDRINSLLNIAVLVSWFLCLYSFNLRVGDLPISVPTVFEALVPFRFFFLLCALLVAGISIFRIRKTVFQSVRDFAALIAIICCYPLVPTVIGAASMKDQDGLLFRIDQILFFGKNPFALLESVMTSWLSEWMAFCYVLYGFQLMIVLGVLYLKKNEKDFRSTAFGVTLALAVGYIGYTLVPAVGPVFTLDFNQSLNIPMLGDYKNALIDRARIDRDCFPSLHTCISIFLEWCCWKYEKFLFWIFLPVTLTMPFACVYLRYHYVTDVLAGIALCFGVIYLTKKIMPRTDIPLHAL